VSGDLFLQHDQNLISELITTMGTGSSRHEESGSLQGAYAPPLPGLTIPEPPLGAKKFKLKIPEGKKTGDAIVVNVDGKTVRVFVPSGTNPVTGRNYKPGDYITWSRPGETEKVIASTLPTVPGMEIVQAKPIIWATASHAYFRSNWNDQSEQTSMAKGVGDLLQRAQEALLKKCIDVGCNAVLGMTITVTNDSSGERGNSKIVIVTVCGTPCSLLPMQTLPAVNADAVVIPLYATAVPDTDE
jgi:uncharacterized protein YbjQ (UPF0145 family)